jgi:hypothetical protein
MSYVDQHHTARRILRDVRDGIDSLSRAFDRTGNKKVAKELEDLFDGINNAIELYDDAFHLLQQESLDYSRSTVNGLLGVAMKIDELAKKSEIMPT